MKQSKDSESPASPKAEPEARHHPDGAFDDPLHEWWQKNGKSIISGAVLAVLATALVFGVRAYRKGQVENLQSAYNEALAADELGAFATDHSGHPLAGVAALRTANVAFEESDWNTALENYTIAVDSLTDNPLHGKARLGLAATLGKVGDEAEAAQVFEALANDETAFRAARAEAMYFLALMALSRGDEASFEQWRESLGSVDSMSLWQGRLQYYSEKVAIPVVETPSNDAAGEEEASEEGTPPTGDSGASAGVPAETSD